VTPTARPATSDDLPELNRLYLLLEAEMTAMKDMWGYADGLADPIEDSLAGLVNDMVKSTDSLVVVGELESNPVGFLYAHRQELLPQGTGTSLASIRLVFTEEPARAVGVGSTMRDFAIDHFSAMGIERFDAHVLPGHRMAKNFFESGGFSARSIVMHRGAK